MSVHGLSLLALMMMIIVIYETEVRSQSFRFDDAKLFSCLGVLLLVYNLYPLDLSLDK